VHHNRPARDINYCRPKITLYASPLFLEAVRADTIGRRLSIVQHETARPKLSGMSDINIFIYLVKTRFEEIYGMKKALEASRDFQATR